MVAGVAQDAHKTAATPAEQLVARQGMAALRADRGLLPLRRPALMETQHTTNSLAAVAAVAVTPQMAVMAGTRNAAAAAAAAAQMGHPAAGLQRMVAMVAVIPVVALRSPELCQAAVVQEIMAALRTPERLAPVVKSGFGLTPECGKVGQGGRECKSKATKAKLRFGCSGRMI